ncbi:MAG: outer membrane beta-barrel protein [Bacteroides sp.]|nr:outer membrane beta-barrel protein [Bacteroides sp.]
MLAIALQTQAQNLISLKLENKPLPAALKLIEREGGKNVIFSVTETEKHSVSADIRQKTQAEAIDMVLQGTPFIYKERTDYFAIQKKDAHAKAIEIRGMVMNEKNEPMPYCNVLLLTSDSTFVNGCVTMADGSFLMMGEEDRPYLIKASYIGYVTTTQALEARNLIQLLPDSHTLEEVTITAERPLIEPSANGLKANVVGTSLAKMGTASEMLSHLPFVTGNDGNYTVLGHGSPLIYINNRKVRDMGELDRLRADEIVSAEVITTPGAEYAADVPAVIRIRTIKQHGQGWSGNVNLNYSQGHWAKANQQVNLNYRTGGLDLFSRISVFEDNRYGKTTEIIRINGTDQWDITINDTQTGKNRNLNLEAGFNYEVNENHSFGMRYQPTKSLKDYTTRSWGENIASCNGAEADWMEFNQSTQGKFGWDHSVSAYYAGIIGKWKIDFDADFLNNRKTENQIAEDESKQDIHSQTRSSSKLYAAKLQASVSLGKGKLSFGSEGTMTERIAIFTQSGYSADAHDLIKQKSLAGFANYAVSFGNWKANAGVRYEHRETDYYDEGIRVAQQSPTYNDFIPTASLSWADNGLGLSLSYRMMKAYPGYFLLSNAISYRNQYEYNTGNPLLEPCQTYYLNLTGSYKWLYATLQYKRVKNNTANICMPYNEETHPGVLLFGSANVATYNGYSFELVASPQIGCWQPQFTAYVSLSPTDGRNLGIEVYRKQLHFLFEWDNSFRFSNGWFLNIQADYQPACHSGFAVFHTTGQVNARVSKSFLKDNAMTLALTASDIFRTGNYYFHIHGINSSVQKTIYRDFQRIGIQLSYKFNATKSKYKGTGAGQSEKSRL